MRNWATILIACSIVGILNLHGYPTDYGVGNLPLHEIFQWIRVDTTTMLHINSVQLCNMDLHVVDYLVRNTILNFDEASTIMKYVALNDFSLLEEGFSDSEQFIKVINRIRTHCCTGK